VTPLKANSIISLRTLSCRLTAAIWPYWASWTRNTTVFLLQPFTPALSLLLINHRLHSPVL